MGEIATPDNMVLVAQAAERFGFESISVGEHLIYPADLERSLSQGPHRRAGHAKLGFDPSETANMEIFTTLSFVAAHTSTLRLQSGVVVLPYHMPFLLAKQAATLDVLSGGRFELGIGVGWLLNEFEVFKVPYDERGAITDEYLAILHALWNDQPFDGRYYQFPRVHSLPKPVQKPLPIVVGGAGRIARRRVAKFGHAWRPMTLPTVEEWSREREMLIEELEKVGRGIDEIVCHRNVGVDFGDGTTYDAGIPSGEVDKILERIQAWSDAGADVIWVTVGDYHYQDPKITVERLQWFSEEVMPQTANM
jgi:probable F420-dependent oxidoreductase